MFNIQSCNNTQGFLPVPYSLLGNFQIRKIRAGLISRGFESEDLCARTLGVSMSDDIRSYFCLFVCLLLVFCESISSTKLFMAERRTRCECVRKRVRETFVFCCSLTDFPVHQNKANQSTLKVKRTLWVQRLNQSA